MEPISQPTKDWLSEQFASEFHIEKHSYSNQDEVYRIKITGKTVYLKIAVDLEKERSNLIALKQYLQVPMVISFEKLSYKDHLLISEVPGRNLAELVGEWNNEDIVKEFARATRRFHSLDIHSIFSERKASGLVVSHGDMALPNIICTKPGSASYIDVGQMSTREPDADLADAIWSLQRNMGPEYGELFLKEYGDVVMTEKIDQALRFRYLKTLEQTG